MRFLKVRLVVGVARVASSLGSHCKKAQMTACTTACRVQEPSKPDNEDPSLRDEDGDALVPGTLPPTNHTPTQPLQKDVQDLDPGSTQPMRRRSVTESSTQPLDEGLSHEKEARTRLLASCERHGQSGRENDPGASLQHSLELTFETDPTDGPENPEA